MEKVKVTVHLTAEAAGILSMYGGDRNRGEFLSDLLIAHLGRDRQDSQRYAQGRALEELQKAAQAAAKVLEASSGSAGMVAGSTASHKRQKAQKGRRR